MGSTKYNRASLFFFTFTSILWFSTTLNWNIYIDKCILLPDVTKFRRFPCSLTESDAINCKKKVNDFPVPGCHLTNSPWPE